MKILFASSLALSLVSLTPSLAAECRNPVACVSVSQDGERLRASIALAPRALPEFVSIEEIATGAPDAIVVEWLDAACGAYRDLALDVNGVPFSIATPCEPGAHTVVVDDPGIAAAWREHGSNLLRLSSRGPGGEIAWARVRAGEGFASRSTRLFDIQGGGLRGDFEVGTTLVPGPSAKPRLRVPGLPSSIDVSSLADGPHALCVVSGPDADCVTFVHDGEATLTIGGVPTAPVADAGASSTAECASPYGTPVSLDGSASTGSITLFEWFENYGTQSQTSLGTGMHVQATLPLGQHAVTLKVTDAFGQTALAGTVKTVQDTKAPVVRVTTNPVVLWPADHRMVEVTATPLATDVCGSASIVLLSVTSNEPDDALGPEDGSTTGDIQGVTTGIDDRQFQLRAETGPVFGGRRYLLTYAATDGSGNKGMGRIAVTVQLPRKISPPVETNPDPTLSLRRGVSP